MQRSAARIWVGPEDGLSEFAVRAREEDVIAENLQHTGGRDEGLHQGFVVACLLSRQLNRPLRDRLQVAP